MAEEQLIVDRIKEKLSKLKFSVNVYDKTFTVFESVHHIEKLGKNSRTNSFASAVAKSIIDGWELKAHGNANNLFHATAEKDGKVFETDSDRDVRAYSKMFTPTVLEPSEFWEYIESEARSLLKLTTEAKENYGS